MMNMIHLLMKKNAFIDDCGEIMNECEEMEFIETNPSKDELLEKHPEYEKYFAEGVNHEKIEEKRNVFRDCKLFESEKTKFSFCSN